MRIIRQDLRYAFRSARRTPLLTSIVVLALSVGIGLNTGVFTLLNFLFLQPPVKKDPASFIQIYPRYEGWFTGAAQSSSFTAADYNAIRRQAHTLAGVAASASTGVTLDDVHQRTASLLVSCNYFDVYGIDRPLLGRFFLAGECNPGTSIQIVVLSEHFWKSLYAADPHIVGKVIHVNRQPFTVVGIAADSSANFIPAGLWIPYSLQPELDRGNNLFRDLDSPWLTIEARVGRTYSRADAKAELETILRQQDRLYLAQKTSTLDRNTSVLLTNGSLIQDPAAQSQVTVLMALILGPLSLVLLLACTNVTMLFLSRSVVRRGEIAVRLALGVSRTRLMRMLVIESLLTAAFAGIISVGLAYRVPVLITNTLGRHGNISPVPTHPDWMVFVYLAGLVLVATLVSALAPMRESFKIDVVTALKGRAGSATIRSHTISALIVGQLAMSFVLLVAAVFFGRLPALVTGMDPGFEIHHTMAVPLNLNSSPDTKTAGLAFSRTLEARILQIPGVQALAYESLGPFRQQAPDEIRLSNQAKGHGRPASVDDVSSDFFATFGVPLVQGRSFQHSDSSSTTSQPVAVVSEAFASAFWGNKNPIGRTILTADDKHLVVVGVARDTRSEHFGVLDGPRLYTLRDPQSLEGQLFVRFTGEAARVAAAIEVIVKSLDPDQVDTPQTIWDSLESNATAMRSLADIILWMTAFAVMLAVTGVYGVLSFAINQRTREFGIQMVLGASRRSIFRSVMLRGCRQIALGLLGGIALAEPAVWLLMRLSRNSPLPLKAFDVPVFCISALVLLIVSLSAMYLPAFRATRVDPMQALRNE